MDFSDRVDDLAGGDRADTTYSMEAFIYDTQLLLGSCHVELFEA